MQSKRGDSKLYYLSQRRKFFFFVPLTTSLSDFPTRFPRVNPSIIPIIRIALETTVSYN